MKLVKGIFGLLLIIILVAAAALAYVYINRNVLVKEAVETHGPEVTKTIVTLDKVDIGLFDGKVEMNDFLVGNPEGFESSHLLKWNTIRVQVDPKSLGGDVLVLNDITIDGVSIVAEQKGLTTNLQKLLETLESGGGSESTSSGESSEGQDVRLMLEHMKFSNNSINFVTEKFGDYTLDLPSFELTNIGDKETGLTPEEFGAAILKPLLKQAQRAVEKRAKDIAKEELEAKLEEKKEELKAKAKEKEEELKAKAEEEEEKLKAKAKEKEDELKEKHAEDIDKLKNLFKKN